MCLLHFLSHEVNLCWRQETGNVMNSWAYFQSKNNVDDHTKPFDQSKKFLVLNKA